MARRNLRLGRGDRRGAFRVSAFLFAVGSRGFCSGASRPDLEGEFDMLLEAIGEGSLAALVWLIYVALEPIVRRRWPDLLISWTRLLSGRFRDPLVGRDLLAGLLLGSAWTLAFVLSERLALLVQSAGLRRPCRRRGSSSSEFR